MALCKRVLVTFGTSPVRKKVISLPEKCDREVEFVQRELFSDLSLESGLHCFGSIAIFRFDQFFEEDVELNLGDKLFNGDKLTARVIERLDFTSFQAIKMGNILLVKLFSFFMYNHIN